MPALEIDAHLLKLWLSDGHELALIDVREHGQYGMGHLFFAVPLPYSRFELGLRSLVPNPAARVVFCDAGDGVAVRAAARAESLGYKNVHILTGGVEAWQRAGYMLYLGVNVPSKAFGELIEHQRHTPRLSAQAVQAMRANNEDFVIVDGRPLAEFRKMSIPGGICCPNGELALRIRNIAPDPRTKIIVNCAGRTRSVIGAQTLIDLGVPNPVFALENGTQGWFLAGFDLERGATRRYPQQTVDFQLPSLQAAARAFATSRGANWVSAETVITWLSDPARTTYTFDIRSAEEFTVLTVPGFVNAPGGQLIQATDQWVAVKSARIVVADDELVRAPVVAGWLCQLGHEAYVLEPALGVAARCHWRRPADPPHVLPLPAVSVPEAVRGLQTGSMQLIDLRPSMAFREGHIDGAVWSMRPLLPSSLSDLTGGTIRDALESPS